MNILELKQRINDLLDSPKIRQCGKTERFSDSLQWKFRDLLDEITRNNLVDLYDYEIHRMDEGGELIDDQEFQQALETVIKYYSTTKQIEEFNLTYKNK